MGEANDQKKLMILAKSNGVSDEGIKHIHDYNPKQNDAGLLDDTDLENVVGGAFPSAVNSQIT